MQGIKRPDDSVVAPETEGRDGQGYDLEDLGAALVDALEDAIAVAEGKDVGQRVHTVPFDSPDVAALRSTLDMDQETFARTYQIPVQMLQLWEARHVRPDGPSAAYLKVISRRPEETAAALREAG